MAYAVRVTETAENELEETYAWIHKKSPLNAERWRFELLEKAVSLENFPERCPLAPENEDAKCELRQLILGNYRILFTIMERTVYVLHVRHGARESIAPEDITLP